MWRFEFMLSEYCCPWASTFQQGKVLYLFCLVLRIGLCFFLIMMWFIVSGAQNWLFLFVLLSQCLLYMCAPLFTSILCSGCSWLILVFTRDVDGLQLIPCVELLCFQILNSAIFMCNLCYKLEMQVVFNVSTSLCKYYGNVVLILWPHVLFCNFASTFSADQCWHDPILCIAIGVQNNLCKSVITSQFINTRWQRCLL